MPLPIGRQDPESGHLHHCRYPQAVPAGAGPGRFGGDNPLLEKRLLRPHRGRSVPQWPIRQFGDGAKRPSLRLSQVSKRLRSWLLPGCRGPGQTIPPWSVGCKWGGSNVHGIGAMGPAEPRPQGQARPGFWHTWPGSCTRCASGCPCWLSLDLQGDWRLRQGSEATEARAHLPKQIRRWGGLRIAAVRLSSTREGARIRLRWFSCWKRSWR